MSDHASAIKGLPRWHRDPLVQSAIGRIRGHGWAVTAVSDECDCDSAECIPPDCSFAYTTGLGLHSLPELAVYGLDATTSGHVLNELGDLLHGYDWCGIVDESVELPLRSLDVPIRLIELIDKQDLIITNALFPNSPALQVVWPDDHGTFPWDEGYALQPNHQQIKGMLPDVSGGPRSPRVITPPTAPNRAARRQAQRRKNRP
jgi:Domain of unknown function (DUF4262)